MTNVNKEYAEALFLLACEEEREEAFMEALDTVLTLGKEEPMLWELLTSPSIPLRERLALIEKIFEPLVPEQVCSLLCLLCEKGRIGSFSSCAEEYRALLQHKQSVSIAKVTSAVPLTETEIAALKAKLSAISKTTVELSLAVDPAILGGVIVEWNGTVTDGSLRHRLHEVKEVMNQ